MSTLRAVDLIKTAAENIEGFTFITGTRFLSNIEADDISLPICILDRPVRIPITIEAGGLLKEQFSCTVLFFNKSELEYQFEQHEPIIGAMKLAADQFIVNLDSFNQYIESVTNIVYTDLINALDTNLTGVQVTFDLALYPLDEQVCPTGTFTPPDLPPFNRYLTEVAVDGVTITGNGTESNPLVAIGGGGGGVGSLRVQDEGNTLTNAATTLNFTGNVTASLASAGNVTVNVPAPTAQVNSDWNATSGVAEILNKPTIPAAQVNSDWNASSGVAEILNKPTIPSITGLVPYTGANQDVDLGANGLDAEFIKVTGVNGNGHLNLRHQATNPTATGQSTAIFADNNGNLKIKNDGLSYATFDTNGITADRSYEFPDKSGTVAMTSDVQVYTEGTGIDITSNVITNTAPDQTVVLTAGAGIGVSGTYPNFTITNSRPAYILYKNVDNQTAVTGNTNNNKVLGVLIPANTVAVGSIMNIKARVGKTGGAGITTLRIYANTADSIVSPAPTLLMTSATTAIGNTYNGCDRNAVVKSSTVTQTAQANASIQNDGVVGNATLTNSNIDWTVDQYIIFAIQNGANGDSTVLSYIEIEIK